MSVGGHFNQESPGFCESNTNHIAQEFCKEPTFLHPEVTMPLTVDLIDFLSKDSMSFLLT